MKLAGHLRSNLNNLNWMKAPSSCHNITDAAVFNRSGYWRRLCFIGVVLAKDKKIADCQ